jgi:DNA gyrase subunit A
MTVRIPVDSISCIGRNTQGVRLIKTEPEDRVSGVVAIVPEDEEPPGADEGQTQEETEEDA